MQFSIKLLFGGLFLLACLPATAQQTPLQGVQAAGSPARSTSDSLTKTYTQASSQLHKQQQMLQHKADSLRRLGQPAEHLQHKIDSVQKAINGLGEKYTQRLAQAQQKASAALQKLKLPGQASSITDKLSPSVAGALPAAPLPSVGLPSTGLNVPQANVPGLPSAPSLPGSSEMKEVQQLVSVKNTKGAEQLAKKEAEKILTKQAGAAGLPSAEGLVSDVMGGTSTPSAKNHFAEKEKELKNSMDELGKLKDKYENVNDAKEFLKKHPNEMKGKPLAERLRPGFYLQINKATNQFNIDINPTIGYRFTGKITAGLGWNHRLSYDTKGHNFPYVNVVFGPRLYGEYNLGKGFYPRLELEAQNVQQWPASFLPEAAPGERAWKAGIAVGMKKEFKITSSVRGVTLLLINPLTGKIGTAYNSVVQVRVGIEIVLKKKKHNLQQLREQYFKPQWGF